MTSINQLRSPPWARRLRNPGVAKGWRDGPHPEALDATPEIPPDSDDRRGASYAGARLRAAPLFREEMPTLRAEGTNLPLKSA